MIDEADLYLEEHLVSIDKIFKHLNGLVLAQNRSVFMFSATLSAYCKSVLT